jgi:hypothetical protein
MSKIRLWGRLAGLAVIITFFMASCYEYHDDTYLDELDLSLTYYDTSFNFQNYNTFAIRDSVGLIEDNMSDAEVAAFYAPNGGSEKIKQYVRQHFLDLGYTEVASTENFDFGVNLVVAKVDNTYVYSYPGWWYGYYDYYSYYWYGWYPYYPYYPWYYTSYTYTTGTLLTEMVDGASLRAYRAWAAGKTQNEIEQADPNDVPDVIFRWQAIVNGVAGSTTSYNDERAQRGIDEVFTQSPYLIKQ